MRFCFIHILTMDVLALLNMQRLLYLNTKPQFIIFCTCPPEKIMGLRRKKSFITWATSRPVM